MPDVVRPEVIHAAREFCEAWWNLEQGFGHFNIHQHHDAVVKLEVAARRLSQFVPGEEPDDDDDRDNDRDDGDDDDDRRSTPSFSFVMLRDRIKAVLEEDV